MLTTAGYSPHTILGSRSLTRRELTEIGITRHFAAKAVAAGRLIRLRRGRLVRADTHPALVQAGRLGGRLDCISLLTTVGVFVLTAPALHIQVEKYASRLPQRPRDVVPHWRKSARAPGDLAADLIEALAQSCRCQRPREAIATLDSAWHLGLIDESDIAEVFARLPHRFQRLRGLLDPRSESGAESVMRLLLRGLGCRVDLQVRLNGVGRVDFIVDGWLIVECDSKAHHEGWAAQKRDRRRDLAAAALGYTTVRPLAEDILYRRDETLLVMKAIIDAHRAR